ncbi:MAG: hypothetical protein JXJ04_13275 [Spirochaetales bacterium]|nr:hypothetical protein [Spirochaetales bacterium]
MKRSHKTIFISAFISIITLCTIVSETDDVIGIVLTIKGNLVQEQGDTVSTISPGDKVYKDSVIRLEDDKGRAKVQIGSDSGPVIYTRFPVKFATTSFASLSPGEQDNYISCIGGTVLKSRSVNLFDWFMKNLGAIGESDIKNGFSVVFSKTKNSEENLSLDPLYFKLKDDIRIKSITGTLINKDENNRVESETLKIEKKGSDWKIAFDQYPYEYAIEYAIKTSVIYMDDKTEIFEFSFYVYGKEEIDYIEAEAKELFTPGESEFKKAIIRAGHYRNYEMHIKGMEILKEAGVDIEGLL